MINLEKQRSKLETAKQKLKERQKLVRDKEKRSSQYRLNNLGKLLVKAKISHLDPDVLLGALFEVSEKAKDEKKIEHWKNISQMHQEQKNKGNAIIISFNVPPEVKIREKLKELNFKWNSFRGEYYGFGDKNAVSELLKNHECKIETFNEPG